MTVAYSKPCWGGSSSQTKSLGGESGQLAEEGYPVSWAQYIAATLELEEGSLSRTIVSGFCVLRRCSSTADRRHLNGAKPRFDVATC